MFKYLLIKHLPEAKLLGEIAVTDSLYEDYSIIFKTLIDAGYSTQLLCTTTSHKHSILNYWMDHPNFIYTFGDTEILHHILERAISLKNIPVIAILLNVEAIAKNINESTLKKITKIYHDINDDTDLITEEDYDNDLEWARENYIDYDFYYDTL